MKFLTEAADEVSKELSKLAGVRLPWRELPSPIPLRLLGWYLGELELLSELEAAAAAVARFFWFSN